MGASERVTWETCPGCGHSAAVGWLGGISVEFDCPRGCRLTDETSLRGARANGKSLSAVARWTVAPGST
jgi:hypothetical protein